MSSTGVFFSGATRGEVGRQRMSPGPSTSPMRAWIASKRFSAVSTVPMSRASAHSKRSLTPGPNSGRVSLIHAPWLAQIEAA